MQNKQQSSTPSVADGTSTITTTMPSDDGAHADRGKSAAEVAAVAGATAGVCFFLFLLLVYFLQKRRRSRHSRVAVEGIEGPSASVVQNATFMIHMSDLDPAQAVVRDAPHLSSGDATVLSTHTYTEIGDGGSSSLYAGKPAGPYMVATRALHSGLAPSAGYTALNSHHATYNGMAAEPANVGHEPGECSATPQRKVTLRHPRYVNVATDTDGRDAHGDFRSKASHYLAAGVPQTSDSDARSHAHGATGYSRLMAHTVYDASKV
jgi:hypothetical protein